jgi:hypothetical protein
MPNDEGHIEAMRAWADALAEKVKAVAHRLEPEALARLGDQAHIEALAKRLYVQTWRCRPDKRKSDPLPPEIEGDILWLERVAERLAKDDARIKALRSREMPPEEWEEALTQAFDAIDGEEKL